MRLSDCFMETITYVLYVLDSVSRQPAQEQPSYEEVEARVLQLLEKSQECLAKGVGSQEDYDLARFAVCAWIDEAILNSSWQHKQRWQAAQLQRRFYNTTNAGEEFFDKLNSLGPHQRDVREVYYLCLSLGFMGRFCRKEDQYLLEQLKVSNLKLLTGATAAGPVLAGQELFPAAYPDEVQPQASQPAARRLNPFVIGAAAAPVVLFGVLFVIYKFILSGVGSDILNLVY
jgi:type VI secretion system protein ImpK